MHSDNINQEIPSGVTKCGIVLVQVDSHPDRQGTLRPRGQEVYSVLNLALMGRVITGRLYIRLCKLLPGRHLHLHGGGAIQRWLENSGWLTRNGSTTRDLNTHTTSPT